VESHVSKTAKRGAPGTLVTSYLRRSSWSTSDIVEMYLAGSVPTGNCSSPALTSGAFDFCGIPRFEKRETWGAQLVEPWSPSDSPFGAATFVGLRWFEETGILMAKRLRLEDVASGYWTLPFKQSSGQVSHYGSSPSSSARASRLRVSVL
jgi:hypothetical protein